MLNTILKRHLKAFLERNGWYLRKTAGLPSGVDCFHELRYQMCVELNLVFDVGAHRGETTFAVLERFPAATIHAFEPVRANFEALKAAVEHIPSVICHQLALGDQPGVVEILNPEHSQTYTLKKQVPAQAQSTALTTSVTVSTLDAFLRNMTVGRIDLLKLDVEGYELKVLTGAHETLSTKPPKFLLVEASLDKDDEIHSPFMELDTFLSKYQYRLLSIYDQVIWPNPNRLAYFNALFGLEGLPPWL
jgi:FkbM family methyltransferase